MKRIYQEGALRFTFSREWMVRKFDHHSFYKVLSSAGLKGVDFIAVRPGQLVLIEVKNYRHVRNGHRRPAVQQSLNRPHQIATSIAHKYSDTRHAIRAIQSYYRRHWEYRLMTPTLSRFRWQWSERSFWTHAAQLEQSPGAITFLLWLATDPGDQQVVTQLHQALRKELADEAGQLYVTDEHHEPLPGLTVEWNVTP